MRRVTVIIKTREVIPTAKTKGAHSYTIQWIVIFTQLNIEDFPKTKYLA